MLPKRSRVTSETIEKHLIRARRLKTATFLVMYEVAPTVKGPQVSVTASKKVAPTAVMRNKLRRRAYTALAPLLSGLPKTAAVLVSYTACDVQTSIADLRAELQDAFLKAKLYRA